MSLHKDIKEEIPNALKARDKDRLNAARNLLAALTNELVLKGKKPQDSLEDGEVLEVIKRSAKQRKDSITQFEEGGRAELAEREKKELDYLSGFLPQMMSREQITRIAEEKKEELSITDKSPLDPAARGKQMGMFMGVLMKELKGKADGSVVKEVVEELFK